MSDCRSGVEQLDAELQLCLADLKASATDSTFTRIVACWWRFGSFVTKTAAGSLDDVTPVMAATFVRSRTSSGSPPGIATMHNRRTSLRLLFRTARRLRLADGDPTLDLNLPPRVVGQFRPLTDDEIIDWKGKEIRILADPWRWLE